MAASDHSLVSAATLLAEYPKCSLEQLQKLVEAGYLRPFYASGELIHGHFEFSNFVSYLSRILEDLPGGCVSRTPREVYFLESEVERLLKIMAAYKGRATSPEGMLTELRTDFSSCKSNHDREMSLPGGFTKKQLLAVADNLIGAGRLKEIDKRRALAFKYREMPNLQWDRAYQQLPGVDRMSKDKTTREGNFYRWAREGEDLCRKHAAQ